MGLDLQRGHLCTFLFFCLLACLTLILAPLSYSYIPRNEMGFRKHKRRMKLIKLSFSDGRYFWGVGKTTVVPQVQENISDRFGEALRVPDSGQVGTLVVSSLPLAAVPLERSVRNFALNYEQRVIAVARSSLRNAAANLAMSAYIQDRSTTITFLYNAIRQALLTGLC